MNADYLLLNIKQRKNFAPELRKYGSEWSGDIIDKTPVHVRAYELSRKPAD